MSGKWTSDIALGSRLFSGNAGTYDGRNACGNIVEEPPIVDTLKRGQPLNKGQVVTLTSHSDSSQDNLSPGVKGPILNLPLVERLH